VNAVELMPINEFEGNDSWGYNPSFYFATDKAYGTPNDYKQFIDEAHNMVWR
jgi:1,4-alpha-glucan branching enzyme